MYGGGGGGCSCTYHELIDIVCLIVDLIGVILTVIALCLSVDGFLNYLTGLYCRRAFLTFDLGNRVIFLTFDPGNRVIFLTFDIVRTA